MSAKYETDAANGIELLTLGHVSSGLLCNMEEKIAALLRQGRERPSYVISDEHLANLPEAVQRYLRAVRIVGKRSIRTAHLKQEGFFRRKEGQRWTSFTAEQYFSANPPGFVWQAQVRVFPFLNISVTDAFVGGHGRLVAKLLSFVPLADVTGPEADQGQLLRYLGEVVWFPTAWLSDYLRWEAIDEHSAKVTLHHESATVSAVIDLDEEHRMKGIRAQRYREEDGILALRPWSGRASGYQEVGGMLIPMQVEVIWHLDSGDLSYFRGEITSIAYDV